MNDWLTSEQVEHIQWAVQRNRPVGSFVNGLRHATLPALLEYGCLRAHLGHDIIPPLRDLTPGTQPRTPGRVDLARGTCHVGYADGETAAPILAAAGGVGVYVRVESKNDLSGVAQVRIVKPGEAT